MMYQPKRRSLLIFPASNSRYHNKAINSEADALIYDLEDSIATSAKGIARDTLANNFPSAHVTNKELMIRINDARSSFYDDDLRLISDVKPHTVATSKTEDPGEIKRLCDYLKQSEYKSNLTQIFVGIESIAGFYKLRDILGSTGRVTAAIMGVEDLVNELGIERGELGENPLLNHMLAEFAIACQYYKVQFIGPVTKGYKTKEHNAKLLRECRYVKSMNGRGKVAIHPNQIQMINHEFNIGMDQIKAARKTINLFSQSKENGSAVISINNEMQDTPSLKKARNLLTYAKEHGFMQDESS